MMKRLVPIFLGMVLIACSAKTPNVAPTGPSSSSRSASPGPSRAPVIVAQKAVFAAQNGIWIYDVKTNAVTQFAQGENIALPKFITASQVSFIQDAGDSSILRSVDLKTRQLRDLFTVNTKIDTYGWSPDHQTIAYVTTDEAAYPHLYFREVVGEGAPRHVTTLARALGREGEINDQTKISWSSDGSLVLVVYTPADGITQSQTSSGESQLQVRAADGSLAFAADQKQEPTMGTWSASRVFFRQRSGVRQWTPGRTVSVSVKGSVQWFDPWGSTDGRSIAYDTGASSLSVKVRVYDTRTGVSTDVAGAKGFFRPVFADPRTVWAQRVQKCEPDCLDPIVAGPEVDAFDLRTGKARKLALNTLVDVDVLYGPSA